jgi:hypothetical protein
MSERSDLPDTAMATGNDEGLPVPPIPGPLAPEERLLLDALELTTDGPAEPAVEDSDEVALAVADDAPVPGLAGDEGGSGDGLEPEFTDR